MHIISFLWFCDFVKKTTPLHYLHHFVFVRKKINTHQAPQTDRLNLSFMKGKNIVDKKSLEMVVKRPFIICYLFVS